MSDERTPPSAALDLGHQGDVDYPQLRRSLARTPTERLDHHEGWRLFVKEALRNATLRQGNHRPVDECAR